MSAGSFAGRLKIVRTRFDGLDAYIAHQMDRFGVPVLRYAIAIVFIWFGVLKVFDVSPAGELVAATVYLVPSEVFVPVLGIWEVLIGVCFLVRRLLRLGILLLFIQLPGTFLPLVLLPSVTFDAAPVILTVEGQYIVKNLIIIGAALVIGGTLRDDL